MKTRKAEVCHFTPEKVARRVTVIVTVTGSYDSYDRHRRSEHAKLTKIAGPDYPGLIEQSTSPLRDRRYRFP